MCEILILIICFIPPLGMLILSLLYEESLFENVLDRGGLHLQSFIPVWGVLILIGSIVKIYLLESTKVEINGSFLVETYFKGN